MEKEMSKYAQACVEAHSIVEDWIKRKHIPTVLEFTPYVNRSYDTAMPGLALRTEYVHKISWPIITQEMIQDFMCVCLKLKVRFLLDAGCGHGVLAHTLGQNGLRCVGVNPNEDGYHKIQRPWGNIVRADGIEYVKVTTHIYDGVILSWPPYNCVFGTEVLKVMKSGQFLFYCGEGSGGCTANDAFHELLGSSYSSPDYTPLKPQFTFLEDLSERANDNFLRFDGIHDRWSIFVKK